MLVRALTWLIAGPDPQDALSRLRWAIEDRCWDLRFWFASHLERLLDRLYGEPVGGDPLPVVCNEPLAEPPPLTWDAFPPEPPVQSAGLPSPEMLSCILEGIRDEQANDGLAAMIAGHFDLDPAAVRGRLAALPLNHRHLLDSPQGWSMVGDWVCAELTGRMPQEAPLVPAIH